MIKEAIDKIQQLANAAAAEQHLIETITLDSQSFTHKTDVDGVAGSRKLGALLQPPRPEKLAVTTLTGFIDAIRAGACGDMSKGMVIHVEDYLNVAVKPALSDRYGVRDTLLKATHTPIDAFVFDSYHEPQKFIIALQVAFVPTEEMLHLIKIASCLKAGSSVETNDDGFSQTINVKAGEVKTVDVPIKPRTKLIPLRSFAEANESNPVESEFLVRFKQTENGAPLIALFSVDGQKYKAEIMRSIKKYLDKQLNGDGTGPAVAIPILA